MNTFLKVSMTLVFLLLTFSAFAEPGAPPATPIDGGLSLLLAGGAIYGVKKIRDYRLK